MSKFLDAIQYGDEAVFKKMLKENPALVNERRDEIDYTGMHIAAINNRINMMRKLLKHGADVNARGNNLATPLSAAAISDNYEAAEFLLKNGARIDDYDTEGVTPMLAAAFKGHTRVVELCLNHGASLEMKDASMRTSLLCAVFNGHYETVKLLLDRGANATAEMITRKNQKRVSALALAQVKMRKDPSKYQPIYRLLNEHIAAYPNGIKPQPSRTPSPTRDPLNSSNSGSGSDTDTSTNDPRGRSSTASSSSSSPPRTRDPELLARVAALEKQASANQQSISALEGGVAAITAQQHQLNRDTQSAISSALAQHKSETEQRVKQTQTKLLTKLESKSAQHLQPLVQNLVNDVLGPQFQGQMQQIMANRQYQAQVTQLVQEQITSINTRQQAVISLTQALQAKQIDLTQKTNPLVQKHLQKQALLTEQQDLLNASPQVSRFYKTIEQGLGAKLFGAMILSSQMIERTTTKTENIASAGANVASTLCSLIPVVGEVAGNVMSFGINKIASLHVDNKLEKQNQAVMDGMLRPKDGMKIAEIIARKVTQSYLHEIEPLSESDSKAAAEKAVKVIYQAFTRGDLRHMKSIEQKINHLKQNIDAEASSSKGLIRKKGGIFAKAAAPQPTPSQSRAIIENRDVVKQQQEQIELMQMQMQRMQNMMMGQQPQQRMPAMASSTPQAAAMTRPNGAAQHGMNGAGMFRNPIQQQARRSPHAPVRQAHARGPVPATPPRKARSTPTPPRRTQQQQPVGTQRWR